MCFAFSFYGDFFFYNSDSDNKVSAGGQMQIMIMIMIPKKMSLLTFTIIDQTTYTWYFPLSKSVGQLRSEVGKSVLCFKQTSFLESQL